MWAKRRLLWRVRRKLILSYVFVGVVPALLVITFFLLAGLILAFNISSYLVQSRVRNLTDQARFLAQTVLLEVQRSGTPDQIAEALERRQASTETRYPFVSLAVIPVKDLACKVDASNPTRAPRTLPATLPIVAGPWGHLPPPATLPKWLGCDGFAGIIAYNAPSGNGDGAAAEHAARDAGGGVARSADADLGPRARHADVDGDREPHSRGDRHPPRRGDRRSWRRACGR